MGILSTIFYTVIALFFKSLVWGSVIYAIYNTLLLIIQKRNKKDFKIYILEFAFCCYLSAVFNLTGVTQLRLSSFSGMHAVPNLIPLINTISDFINYGANVVEQSILNIALFIPFGVLVSMLNYIDKKSIIKICIYALITSGCIEVTQYFCGRFADIDDVIFNTTGALIGCLFYIKCRKIIKQTA
ncbi:MAG: VanZ family protein [Peptostreptococcaceae bacterium]